MSIFSLSRLESLKKDYLDNLVDVEAIAADTAKVSIMRYNQRTGERIEQTSTEVNISDLDEAIADTQDKAQILNQLKTVVQNALDGWT
jgi:hypothetical protein